MERAQRQTFFYWAALGAVAVSCCVLGVLQYRWIGEISRAEQDRQKDGLQSALRRLSGDFNSEVSATASALRPSNDQIEEKGRDQAYADRVVRWKSSGSRTDLFRRVALAIPENGEVALREFDPGCSCFAPAAWPDSWAALRDRMADRFHSPGPRPHSPDPWNLIEIPRFPGPGQPEMRFRPREHEWLVLEINLDYVRKAMLPDLISRHLGTDYDVDVFARADPAELIYRSGGNHRGQDARTEPDASVALLEAGPPGMPGRGFRRNSPERGMRPERPMPPADFGRGRWEMAVYSRAGDLGTLVERNRRRNLAVSALILILLLLSVGALLRFSRQAQRLAELQISFVAGISHELNTPLTVIRTAAFNLKGKVGTSPAQVERYAELIEAEVDRLTALVKQVLRYAAASSGRVIHERLPVAVENVIQDGLKSRRQILEGAGCVVEQALEPNLPLVLADDVALRHAIENLIDNAVKYGTPGANCIRVSASRVIRNGSDAIEIRVKDRGPGIPADEQRHLFDAFFRGSRAVQDQIHGTGLGLNLVKRIVEAHGGSISVVSEETNGAEFIIVVPAAPAELQDEFANTVG